MMNPLADAFKLGFIKEAQNPDEKPDIVDQLPGGEKMKDIAREVKDYTDVEFDGGRVELKPGVDEAGLEGSFDLLGGKVNFDAEQNFDNDEFSANADWTYRF
jgi:hypothetical protein